MSRTQIENTLFLGNGFNKVLFKKMPSWGDLFEGQKSEIKNYTFLYEVYLINNGRKEHETKEEIRKKISYYVSEENIKEDISDLGNFGRYLKDNRINNIITTNYDGGIDIILSNKCGYKRIDKPQGLVPEEVFSIRTYKEFENKEMNHRVKLWQIHGNMERIKSITLGFDHYCASLSKLCGYLKGQYESDKGPKCRTPMKKSVRQKHLMVFHGQSYFLILMYILWVLVWIFQK